MILEKVKASNAKGVIITNGPHDSHTTAGYNYIEPSLRLDVSANTEQLPVYTGGNCGLMTVFGPSIMPLPCSIAAQNQIIPKIIQLAGNNR